jgi:hypothetical protein
MLHRVKTIEITRRPRARDEAIIWQNALLSALGQKQTLPGQAPMSALTLKAEIDLHDANVRLSPKASQADQEVCFVPQFVP